MLADRPHREAELRVHAAAATRRRRARARCRRGRSASNSTGPTHGIDGEPGDADGAERRELRLGRRRAEDALVREGRDPLREDHDHDPVDHLLGLQRHRQERHQRADEHPGRDARQDADGARRCSTRPRTTASAAQSIIPSRPRLSTPARSENASPTAASAVGIASWRPAREEADADDLPTSPRSAGEPVGGEDEEDEHALDREHDRVRQPVVDAHRLAADLEKRDQHRGQEHAESVEPAEQGDDDRGEPVARRDPACPSGLRRRSPGSHPRAPRARRRSPSARRSAASCSRRRRRPPRRSDPSCGRGSPNGVSAREVGDDRHQRERDEDPVVGEQVRQERQPHVVRDRPAGEAVPGRRVAQRLADHVAEARRARCSS